MYAELARWLLETGTPLVRGESAHFFPLLYPLLTAPAWLWEDVELAYRTVQAFNAVAMSLAAIPVFLLARRLRVGDGLALVAAALAVVLPELLYSSSLLAESLAYPLALAAVAAAVAVFERPLLRLQLAFLACSGLAACSRIQLAVLPLCYLAAIVAVGLRERRLRTRLREQWVVVGATVAFLTGGLGLGPVGTLGLYGSLTAYSVEPVGAAKAAGVNALVLGYAVGWVIVPGALLGLGLALARPRRTAEFAFGSSPSRCSCRC
jgi:asparagine N-glycosylation enzyme membrane subunit Stt3